MEQFTVSTGKKYDIVDITEEVSKIAAKSKVKEGLCTVYVPHSTCALMINENYDPNVKEDILECLAKLVPEGKWKHDKIDDNGASHIKSAIVGPSQTIPVKDSKLMLGSWQDIMLADFDGPRERNVLVTIVGK